MLHKIHKGVKIPQNIQKRVEGVAQKKPKSKK